MPNELRANPLHSFHHLINPRMVDSALPNKIDQLWILAIQNGSADGDGDGTKWNWQNEQHDSNEDQK